MQVTRALLVALAALCLAVLSVGLTPASAHGLSPHSASVETPAPALSAAVHNHGHQHDTAAADVSAEAKPVGDHCADDGSKPGTSPCCGFACHAVTPVQALTFGVAAQRVAPAHFVQDEQVSETSPSSLERPPRIG